MNQTILSSIEGLLKENLTTDEKAFLTAIRDYITALAIENEKLELTALRSTMWALYLKDTIKSLNSIGEAFASRVTNTTWKTSEPRVIGYKKEFELFKKALSVPITDMPSEESVRKMIAEQERQLQAKEETKPDEPKPTA